MRRQAPSFSRFAYSDVASGRPSDLRYAARQARGHVHLVEVTARQRGGVNRAIIPYAVYAFSTVGNRSRPGRNVVFRFSDKGWISHPKDAPANFYNAGRVVQPMRLNRSIPVTPEQERRVALGLGRLEIVNSDGALDTAVREYAVDGRQVRVLFGLSDYRYGDFHVVFNGKSVEWFGDLKTVFIEARDTAFAYDVDLQEDLYEGSGGYEGTNDMKGVPRPMCFGIVRNISPVFVDTSYLVYQVHHRLIQSVDAVYDSGVALSFVSNHADYAALTAVSLTTGQYATCLALGLIRLGSTPAGQVTADVHGDAEDSYIDDTAAIAKRILEDFGGASGNDFYRDRWTQFSNNLDGSIGWYVTEPMTVASAVSEILSHCGAWWGSTPTGRLDIDRLLAPDGSNPSLTLDVSNVLEVEIMPPPANTFPPRYLQRVGYQRNWTVQRGIDLAGAVTASRRHQLAKQNYTVKAIDTSIRSDYLLAKVPETLVSLFDEEEDAESLATDLLTLLKVNRLSFRVRVGTIGYLAKLGSTVIVTHPRVNNGQAWDARLIDMTVDAGRRQVDLILWG